MGDLKLVKITDWNPTGIRTKKWPQNRRRDEAINDFKKLKLRNWIQLVKDRKGWNDLGQKTKKPCRVVVPEEEEEEDEGEEEERRRRKRRRRRRRRRRSRRGRGRRRRSNKNPHQPYNQSVQEMFYRFKLPSAGDAVVRFSLW